MQTETGSAVLQMLDGAVRQLREELLTLDRAVQDASAELLGVRNAELAAYKRLAELRLEQLTRGGVVQSLDAVSHRVRELLERRQAAAASTRAKLDDAERRLAELEGERETQRRRVESAAGLLDAREAAVQQGLADDTAHAAQLDAARRAETMADEAERKTADAEQDRAAKGAPYESDPLFMYLWRRGYGTSAYRANPLARLLDAWVARLCGYRAARPNYWMLLEIPPRLRAHAERLRAAASAEFDKLKAIEAGAAEEGGVPALAAALAAEEGRLEEQDEALAAEEQTVATLLAQSAAFAAGDDESMQNALAMVATELRSEAIDALRRQAAATPAAEDDRLVAAIQDHEEEHERFEAALLQAKSMHDRHFERLRELEDVRKQFKRQRYDDLHSVFTNAPLLALTLNEFLRGASGGGDLWKALKRCQRFRQVEARPTFGTGGFPGRNGTWRLPKGGGWNFPHTGGGGFGGGGFRTGGGFGRGGFKTGGGF